MITFIDHFYSDFRIENLNTLYSLDHILVYDLSYTV